MNKIQDFLLKLYNKPFLDLQILIDIKKLILSIMNNESFFADILFNYGALSFARNL